MSKILITLNENENELKTSELSKGTITLADLVGGLGYGDERICVELVAHLKGFDVWVDEEGLYNDRQIYAYNNSEDSEPMYLAGNLVFTKGADREGNTLPIDSEDFETVAKIEAFIKDRQKLENPYTKGYGVNNTKKRGC